MAVSVKNFLDSKKETLEGSHEGIGPFDLHEIWAGSDFKSNVDFFDRVILPPKSTVGEHSHGNNEEMYVFIKGSGIMTVDGEEIRVSPGDMVLNKPFGTHSLVNDTDDPLDILIIQISL